MYLLCLFSPPLYKDRILFSYTHNYIALCLCQQWIYKIMFLYTHKYIALCFIIHQNLMCKQWICRIMFWYTHNYTVLCFIIHQMWCVSNESTGLCFCIHYIALCFIIHQILMCEQWICRIMFWYTIVLCFIIHQNVVCQQWIYTHNLRCTKHTIVCIAHIALVYCAHAYAVWSHT